MKNLISLVCLSLLVACGSNGGSGGGGGSKAPRVRLQKPVVTNGITKQESKNKIVDNQVELSSFETGFTFTRVFECQIIATGFSATSSRELVYKVIDFDEFTRRVKFLVQVKLNSDANECLSELYTNQKYYIVNSSLPDINSIDFYLDGYTSFYSGRFQNITPAIMMRSSEEQDGVRFASEFGLLLDRALFVSYYNESDVLFVKEGIRATTQVFNELKGSIPDMDLDGLQEFNEMIFKTN